MKKTLIFASVVLGVIFGLSGAASAQGRPVLGGYKTVANTDATAKKAATFAVQSEAKRTGKEIELISVVKAERQVVAGSNYRMCLKVEDSGAEGQDSAEVYVMVVVNIDLKGNYKVLSYDASDCGEEDS